MAQRAFVERTGPIQTVITARPIDLVHLARQCLGDENLELEVLRLFDTTLASYFARVRLDAPADELAMALHAIKGASAGVGAWCLADVAQSLEKSLRDDAVLVAEQVSDLGLAVEEVRAFILRMLPGEDD